MKQKRGILPAISPAYAHAWRLCSGLATLIEEDAVRRQLDDKAPSAGRKLQPNRGPKMKSIFGVAILMAINSAAQAQGMINTEIIRLRAQYRDLASRAAEIEARVGPNHIAVAKVRERMDALRKQIQEEERRIGEDDARSK